MEDEVCSIIPMIEVRCGDMFAVIGRIINEYSESGTLIRSIHEDDEHLTSLESFREAYLMLSKYGKDGISVDTYRNDDYLRIAPISNDEKGVEISRDFFNLMLRLYRHANPSFSEIVADETADEMKSVYFEDCHKCDVEDVYNIYSSFREKYPDSKPKPSFRDLALKDLVLFDD